jgi:7,8-dihydropterin-6-yl-methyl-4-(beta-D-ribofuranosyl)aminobenzene 5'-phosphate synthase
VNSLRRALLLVVVLILTVSAAYVIVHIRAVEQVERDWQASRVERLPDFGSTQHLRITPLVNWHATDSELKTEAGVSYLIQTDQYQLLFDVGFNQKAEQLSPLQHNMDSLGIQLEAIDTLFISHHHLDHAGGQSWVDRGSFSLGLQQTALGSTRVFSPTLLKYPGSRVEILAGPSVIGKGLASIGPIRRRLFLGAIDEQALAINVAGKGIVLVVGCGHQTLAKILQRYDQLFDQPLYGIVGDLHYPLPDGRLTLFGINLQRYLASGSGPWNPIAEADIRADMKLLKQRDLGVIGLGGHDTSDLVIGWFKHHFGQRYHPVHVGATIVID